MFDRCLHAGQGAGGVWASRPGRPAWVTCAMVLCGLIAGGGPANAEAGPPPAGCNGPPTATWLRIVVQGVRSASGVITDTLYPDDPSRFLVKHGSILVGRTKATAGTTETCLFLPKPGVWALAVYHDEANKGHLGRNAIGLPTDGFGFSNNAPTTFGLPSFESIRLAVPHSGMTTHIRLKYP